MKQFLCAVLAAMIESRRQQAELYTKHTTIGWY